MGWRRLLYGSEEVVIWTGRGLLYAEKATYRGLSYRSAQKSRLECLDFSTTK